MPTKILLVEDDPTMRRLLETYLSYEGYETALPGKEEDLEQALDVIRKEKPDIILLDVYLHHLNGFDLLAAIRQDQGLQDIGIIMSSGMDFGQRCIQEGADGFILKPYMPDDLLKIITKLTAKKGIGKGK